MIQAFSRHLLEPFRREDWPTLVRYATSTVLMNFPAARKLEWRRYIAQRKSDDASDGHRATLGPEESPARDGGAQVGLQPAHSLGKEQAPELPLAGHSPHAAGAQSQNRVCATTRCLAAIRPRPMCATPPTAARGRAGIEPQSSRCRYLQRLPGSAPALRLPKRTPDGHA